MKKILFLYKKPTGGDIPQKQQHHYGWVDDCREMYQVEYWGSGLSDITISDLQRKVDQFKPDYIYATMRKRYCDWLPDISNIKVPKIFVECDEYKWYRTDPWYNQFDKVLCRQPWWKSVFLSRRKSVHPKFTNRSLTWNNVPLFMWSVPEIAFSTKKKKRNGIFFLGSVKRHGYTDRKMMYDMLKKRITFYKIFGDKYWGVLHSASGLVCPTESNYGSFVPSKLFEFAASGAAVFTNCDLDLYGIPELKKFIIQYTDLSSLCNKMSSNFNKYHNIAIPVMRGHTHKIRYKKLFE